MYRYSSDCSHSNFSQRRWLHIFLSEKNKDIPADSLEKLVKACGDGCVKGYVRFKKVKPCKGYMAAESRAALHLSKIKAGRAMADGGYAAVVRFRLMPFLVPLAIILLVLGILLSISSKAMPKEEETAEYTIVPEPESVTPKIAPNEYSGLYISVPGYTEYRINAQERAFRLYNPPDNKCMLQYQIYIQDSLTASTGMLMAGEYEDVDLYDRLSAGRYTVKLIAKAYSDDGTTRFNTVSQQVVLISE